MIKNIKKLYAEYEAAQKKMDEADAAWAQNLRDEKVEEAWDKAYRAEWDAFENLAHALEAVTNGAVNRKNARAIIIGRQDELRTLIGRLG